MACINCNNILKKNATKFCCKKCEKEYSYKQYIFSWKEGQQTGTINKKPTPSKHIKKYFKEIEQKCSSCNITHWKNNPILLEIDHIDGDRYNNSIQNLRLLCPNCHSQTDTFRNKTRNSNR